ncbi:MAG: PH domain-containing protein [Acidimicrobiales bacterium]
MTAPTPASPRWQKLHPLTPVVLAGRYAVVLVLVIGEDSARGGGGGDVAFLVALGVVALALTVSVVRWLVTRWALDGVTLRIETGILRRDARQLPLARIQAVDVVRPFLARLVGLAELRVRLAGSSRSGGRLAYLAEPVAVDLRARLMAGHHGLDLATPEPAEQPMATVATGQLVASALLSPAAPVALCLVVAIILLLTVSPAAAAASVGTLVVYLVGFTRLTWRRVADQYGFAVGLAPDGIRVKRGLLSTVSETVPFARVQAVRKIEPLLWRALGWCRLEVDVAGSPGQEQGTRAGRVTKSLLPVGRSEVADRLFSSLLGLRQFELSRPPRRARWKAPFSYHFLAAGCDGAVLAATTGRLKKVTTWVPLEKIQSIRRVEGPLQRALHVATVHADAAGRGVRAELRDRDVEEADRFFNQLVVQSRLARRRVAGSPPAPAPAMVVGNGSQAPVPPAASAIGQPVPAANAVGQPVPAASPIGQPVPTASAMGQRVPPPPMGQPVPPLSLGQPVPPPPV